MFFPFVYLYVASLLFLIFLEAIILASSGVVENALGRTASDDDDDDVPDYSPTAKVGRSSCYAFTARTESEKCADAGAELNKKSISNVFSQIF